MNISDYMATTLKAVQANTLAAITLQVVDLNSSLKVNYLTAFNNWLINYTAGRISDKSTAPQPANGYVVGYFDDPTTGPGSLGPYENTVVQWAYPAIGKDPVCARPPIPDIPKPYVPPDPNIPPLGEVGTKTNAEAGDGFPVGYQATREDGSVWQKFTNRTPFGQVWWWECVKAVN